MPRKPEKTLKSVRLLHSSALRFDWIPLQTSEPPLSEVTRRALAIRLRLTWWRRLLRLFWPLSRATAGRSRLSKPRLAALITSAIGAGARPRGSIWPMSQTGAGPRVHVEHLGVGVDQRDTLFQVRIVLLHILLGVVARLVVGDRA